ncbi:MULTISPECIES: SDR family NAD(P)-dependent oxidoreductase [unclassified Streptomyces]|uniref:SDR family NAD(P)-dependent oxidoreductase n=1 Tax=unclassified Streptomyces TaxID=2593676 RepID=UPI00109E84FE|nr:SDR family NAD(P)-dependent oxidoreductase [Streptomyces sp. A1136]THA56527.1 SDR family NAD(P)-dependent oxidoreductase [Streptomyces sp. A1136]
MRLENRVVVITGASSGIGRATALACARHGAQVVLAARSAGELDRVARLCGRRGGQALAVPTDVTDPEAVTALAAAATARFGRIDVWANVAGVGILGRFDQTPPADLRRLLDVNVIGAVNGARAAVPVMRRQGEGVLIDVASMLGAVVQAPYMSGYAMSKAALVTFDEGLRAELALMGADGIHVCTALPAGVDTPFFRHAANHTGRELRSLPPVATPERVARALTSAMRHPRPRVLVGPYARSLAAAHALAPGLTRAALARRTEHAYLGRAGTAPDGTGNLREPSGGSSAVRGGRRSGTRTAARRTAAAAAGCAALLGARAVVGRR